MLVRGPGHVLTGLAVLEHDRHHLVGQRTQSLDQTGFTVNYTYDPLGRLYKLTDAGGNLIVQYSYDPAGRLKQKDMGNGTRTVYTYDGDGNVRSITNLAPDHVTVNSFDDYTYDPLGSVKTDTNQDGEWVYTYDADSQLTHAVFTPNGSARMAILRAGVNPPDCETCTRM